MHHKHRRHILPLTFIVIGALGALTLAGCTSNKGEPLPRIAYLAGTPDVSFSIAGQKGATEVLAKAGYNLDVQTADYDPGRQQSQCDSVIASGEYVGIIIVPVGNATAIPCVEAAAKAKLPIVALDQQVGPEIYGKKGIQIKGLDGQVFIDQRPLVKQWAQLALDACADSDTCKMGFILGDPQYADQAIARELWNDEMAANPKLQLLGETVGGFSNPDQGISATQNLLQASPDIQLLVVSDDETATGVVAELRRQGLTDKVKVIGNGGPKIAFKRIADGTQFGSVIYTPRSAGAAAADMLIKAIKGDPIDKPSLPYPDISPLGNGNIVVTRDNVDTVKAEY